MPESPSTQSIVARLEGLLGTRDITPKDEGFILVLKHKRIAQRLDRLSDPQIKWMLDLYQKHFGG